MNKIYWFTRSYRKKEAKFRNNLLNEGKSEVSASGLLLCRLCEARARPTGPWLQIEALSQRDVPSTALEFVVASL